MILNDDDGETLYPKTFFDINPAADFSHPPDIDNFESLTSVVMLHEVNFVRLYNLFHLRLTHNSSLIQLDFTVSLHVFMKLWNMT